MSHAIDIDTKINNVDVYLNSQCWKDIEAETGHRTYLSYLKSLPERGPNNKRLAQTLREAAQTLRDSDIVSEVKVLVLDIHQDGSMSASLKTECGGDEADHKAIAYKSSTQVLETLRSPPENVTARIVLWLLDRDVEPPLQIVDAIGLGLNLQPAVLESVLQFVKPVTRERKPDGSGCVTIGDRVATIARDYRPQRHSPPVLLVGGLFDLNYSSYVIPRGLNSTYIEFTYEIFEEEMGGENTSLGPWGAIDGSSWKNLDTLSMHYYLKLLGQYDQQDHRSTDLPTETRLLIHMMQLMRLEILRLRIQCDCVQWQVLGVGFLTELRELILDNSRENNYRYLDQYRFWLRRRLEALRDSRNRFVKFVHLQQQQGRPVVECLLDAEWISLDQDVSEAIAEACVYDAEARDVMQLQTANISILEARKSIQLSNQQMDEAKKVKIFTILAFIYVPLNLATSIFGMNLQPLNQTGQTVTSLLLTAVVALLITALLWFTLVQYNDVREWKRKQFEKLSQAQQEQMVSPRRGGLIVKVALWMGLLREEKQEEEEEDEDVGG